MTISAKVIALSQSQYTGIRIATVQWRYPKFLHGEVMTHRVFSRNASSSRAIPVARLLDDIIRDPAEPIHWGANEKGMAANSELTGMQLWLMKRIYRAARKSAVSWAKQAAKVNGHKQLVNRLVENHGHINVVVTSTKWENFFALRDHPGAQPEIQILARATKDAFAKAAVGIIGPGDWHLPYIQGHELAVATERDYGRLALMSAARCARVSYLTQEGMRPTVEQDLTLAMRLLKSTPAHASPFEHQATPDVYHGDSLKWLHREDWGNLHGWIQHRKRLPTEYVGETEVFSGDRRTRNQLHADNERVKGTLDNLGRSQVEIELFTANGKSPIR